jgi:ABC-type Fe3+/spermidine/putrescine transport system ATPase subunit
VLGVLLIVLAGSHIGAGRRRRATLCYGRGVPHPALELASVSKRFGERRAVDDVSLTVEAGEFVAVVGPSGSGKTTVLRLIAGFEQPDAGAVRIDGRDVTTLPAERRDVSTVFQSYALFPHLSVLENVAYGPRVRGVPRAERRRRAGELLDLVHLPDVGDRRPGELSGGQQQRVALARALANGPSVLLFDEPLGALDRTLRDELQLELRRVQRELGSTFVYVTHDQDEAFGMADRLAVIRDGRIVQLGTPSEVYDRPADAWVATFVGDGNVVPGVYAGGGAADTDLGRLVTAAPVGDLAPGARIVAIARPERTAFTREGHGIPAVLDDVVALGPRLRLTARTAGGVRFVSLVAREAAEPGVTPGDPVRVVLDPAWLAFLPE